MADNPYLINPMEWQEFLNSDSPSQDLGFEITKADIKKYCKHEWVNVGFMHEKIVCKACDILKTEWEAFVAKEKAKEDKDVVFWR